MSRIISIMDAPIPESNVYGTEIRRYYADGIIAIIRKNPGKNKTDEPVWFQVAEDGNLNITYSRILNTEVCDEFVSKFWDVKEQGELHEFISPDSIKGTLEIRGKR